MRVELNEPNLISSTMMNDGQIGIIRECISSTCDTGKINSIVIKLDNGTLSILDTKPGYVLSDEYRVELKEFKLVEI